MAIGSLDDAVALVAAQASLLNDTTTNATTTTTTTNNNNNNYNDIDEKIQKTVEATTTTKKVERKKRGPYKKTLLKRLAKKDISNSGTNQSTAFTTTSTAPLILTKETTTTRKNKTAFETERQLIIPLVEAPKRPTSAYIYFEQFERSKAPKGTKIKTAILSEKWKTMTEEEKGPFIARIDDEKRAYEAWKNASNGGQPQAKWNVDMKKEDKLKVSVAKGTAFDEKSGLEFLLDVKFLLPSGANKRVRRKLKELNKDERTGFFDLDVLEFRKKKHIRDGIHEMKKDIASVSLKPDMIELGLKCGLEASSLAKIAVLGCKYGAIDNFEKIRLAIEKEYDQKTINNRDGDATISIDCANRVKKAYEAHVMYNPPNWRSFVLDIEKI
jgi:hypothetical protein